MTSSHFENHLIEVNGITAGSCRGPFTTAAICPGDTAILFRVGGPFDWDRDGGKLSKTNISSSIARHQVPTVCDTDLVLLKGYDDWSHLIYIPASTNTGATGVIAPNLKPMLKPHGDVTLKDQMNACIELLNGIKLGINSLPDSNFTSPPTAFTITRGLGFPLPEAKPVNPKAIFDNLIGLGNNSRKPFVNATHAITAINSTGGASLHSFSVPTIGFNLQQNKLDDANLQLNQLKVLVSGNPGANATNGLVQNITAGLIKNNAAQKQIVDQINNLQHSIKLQQSYP